MRHGVDADVVDVVVQLLDDAAEVAVGKASMSRRMVSRSFSLSGEGCWLWLVMVN